MTTRALLKRTVAGLLRRGDLNDPRAELWDELCEHGVAHPFFQGELSRWSDAGAILSASARFAPALPLAENILASYFLRAANQALPSPRLTVCDPAQSDLQLSGESLQGTAKLVPFAAVSSHAVAAATSARGPLLVCFELRGIEAMPGQNLAGEPRDTLHIPELTARVLSEDAPLSKLTLLGSLTRATQLVALSEEVLDLTIEHARARVQFGRPIGEFQAVRHLLAQLVEHVAAGRCAVSAAEQAVDRDATLSARKLQRAIASAHIEARSASAQAIAVGHAIHAALGFCAEHRLAHFTTRLMSYRAEFDAPLGFAHRLGSDILSRGAAGLWSDLVNES